MDKTLTQHFKQKSINHIDFTYLYCVNVWFSPYSCGLAEGTAQAKAVWLVRLKCHTFSSSWVVRMRV